MFLQREQLADTVQWKRFLDQFRDGIDAQNRGWRGEPCLLRCYLESEDGQRITLVDYASAGRDWKTVIAAWLPTK